MGGSGGSQARTDTTQRLPEEVRPYYKELMGRASRATKRPFTPYGGQRQAGYTPAELKFQSGVRSLYNRGERPELGRASQQLGLASQYAGDVPMWGSTAYDQYSSPFFEDVIDVEKRRISEDWDRQMSKHRLDSVASGAYGSMGQAAQLASVAQGKQKALADAEVFGRQRAWEDARAGFQADREALSSAATMQANISSQLQSLAQMQQQQSFERLQALESMGAGRREMEQTALDLAYTDFLDQEAYERKMLNWYGAILHGVPLTADQLTIGTPARGSSGARTAGAVLSGIGSIASAAGSIGGQFTKD
jgi:hypothetical protein